MAQFQAAQNQLSTSLAGFGRLLANVEAYPELKSITNYQMLQSQLEGQENRIRVSIRDYNEAVRDYNTRVRTFPEMIGAMIRGAKPMVPYQAATAGRRSRAQPRRQADRKDGVLLLIAPNQRKVRIEVGAGLTAVLSDAEAKRIIEDEMMPHFRAGNVDAAAVAGADALSAVLRTQPTIGKD
jgi:hypothetical protein